MEPDYKNHSESELVRAAQKGCTASFNELVRRNSESLYRFLYLRTGSASDAEDIVQETFLKAYQNLGRYKNQSRFSTWLFTIASRLAVSHYRKKRPCITEIPEPVSTRPTPDQQAQNKESRLRLWSLARQLPEKQYMALELHYAANLPVSEIAQVIGVNRIYIKVLLHRARKNLKAKLMPINHNCKSTASKVNPGTVFVGESKGVL